MRTVTILAMTVILSSAPVMAQRKEKDRLKECGHVMKEILSVPDGIPQELLDKAECVAIFPSVKKFAIGIGGSYGRGALICRSGKDYTGPWGTPAMYAIEGGNIGLQLGGQATDFVLLIMNDSGARSILSSKVKLGADASVAGGPVGRTAQRENSLGRNGRSDEGRDSELLALARPVRGCFAGGVDSAVGRRSKQEPLRQGGQCDADHSPGGGTQA